MDMINKEVTHKSFGDGSIVDQDESFITINFKTESKKFVYPDAFGKFLTLKDRTAAKSLKSVFKKPLKNKNAPLAKYGKMEVTKQPKIPICEVHFHGITIGTNSFPLL